MDKMRIWFKVTGFVCVDVNENDIGDAITSADSIVSDSDFGPLSDITWKFHSCENFEE